MDRITPKQVLNLPMQRNDANAETIREYLTCLLVRVWEEGEGFSGKRPFGNSGWENDLYRTLVQAGMVEGTLDEDGYLDGFPEASRRSANALIIAAIFFLGKGS